MSTPTGAPAARGPNVVIPVVPGDAGPAPWEEARAILDAAVKKAYGTARSIEWLEFPAGKDALADGPLLAPELTVSAIRDAGLALVGRLDAPGDGRAPALEALRRALDLFVDEAVVPSGPRGIGFWIAALESDASPVDLPAGAPETEALLRTFAKVSPSTHGRLRFGSRERVLAYERARGSRETPPLETAVSVTALSFPGAERLVFHAVRGIARQDRGKITCVHGGDASLVERFFRDVYYDHLESQWDVSTFTDRSLIRHELRSGGEDAKKWKEARLAEGWVPADAVAVDEALQLVATGAPQWDGVVATTDAGWLVFEALRARLGVSGPVVRTASGAGEVRVVTPGPFEDGGVDGLVACGREVLRRLGWVEAV